MWCGPPGADPELGSGGWGMRWCPPGLESVGASTPKQGHHHERAAAVRRDRDLLFLPLHAAHALSTPAGKSAPGRRRPARTAGCGRRDARDMRTDTRAPHPVGSSLPQSAGAGGSRASRPTKVPRERRLGGTANSCPAESLTRCTTAGSREPTALSARVDDEREPQVHARASASTALRESQCVQTATPGGPCSRPLGVHSRTGGHRPSLQRGQPLATGEHRRRGCASAPPPHGSSQLAQLPPGPLAVATSTNRSSTSPRATRRASGHVSRPAARGAHQRGQWVAAPLGHRLGMTLACSPRDPWGSAGQPPASCGDRPCRPDQGPRRPPTQIGRSGR